MAGMVPPPLTKMKKAMIFECLGEHGPAVYEVTLSFEFSRGSWMVHCDSAVDLHTGTKADHDLIQQAVTVQQVMDAWEAYKWFESV